MKNLDKRTKISIIVAVYNVEKYLSRCIESILQQTYSNLEILLVNDGSTDNSGKICYKYEKIDKRIVVIDKENGGLTSARKAGFEKAQGEYLAFIDSDDYLEKNYIELLYRSVIENKSDIAICSYYLEYNNKNIVQKFKYLKKNFIKEEYAKELIQPSIYPLVKDQTRIPNFLWLRLYRRDIITEKCFISERKVYTEDLFFNAEAYWMSKKVSIVDIPLYHYCVNEESLTHIYRKNKYIMEKNRVMGISKILDQYEIIDRERLYLANLRLIWECIENAMKLDTYGQYKSEIKKMFQDEDLRRMPLGEALQQASRGEKICYYCFKHKFYLFTYCFKKIMKIRGAK